MIKFSGATTKGKVREKNEDAYLMASYNGSFPYVFAVADGIGGQNAGEIASKAAVEILDMEFEKAIRQGMEESGIGAFFSTVSNLINRSIQGMADDNSALDGMGTTLSVLIFYPENAYIAHIGDSAIYRISENKTIIKLTEDHTYVNELIKNKEISREEARQHPKRNMIIKALACGLEFELETEKIIYQTGDIFVLCTDGLFTNSLSEADVFLPAVGLSEPAVISDYLIKLADDEGGKDNTTIITVRT